MKKFKNLFKYLATSFAFVGMLAGGIFVGGKSGATLNDASAAFSSYTKVENNLPNYLSVESESGNDINDIFLVNTSHSLDVQIATTQGISNASGQNPAYYTETPKEGENPTKYYYFDFTSSLSLYHDLSNTQIKNGAVGENILLDQPISNYVSSGEFSANQDTSFTPKSLDLSIKLNTNLDETDFDGSSITLNEEGCYTLVIPALVYYTQNGGATFTLLNQEETKIYYTFMLFNSDTYFKSSGTQAVDFSSNLHTSSVVSSEAYSLFYFYNYAYGTNVNTLPTLTYDQKFFQINIAYTDLDTNVHNMHVEYQNGKLVCLDENGNEMNEKEKVANVTLNSDGKAKITFINLGEYDISFEYLYIVDMEDGTSITYSLPFEENLDKDAFQNKNQKVFIYGYQAMFADYANKNPETNQPMEKEFKTFKIDAEDSKYVKSADITSSFNDKYNLQSTPLSSHIDLDDKQYPKESVENQLSFTDLLNNYVSTTNPVSTNQPPIKFVTNASLSSANDSSKIYEVTENEETRTLTELGDFKGFNQNTPGTYLYIIQYTYDYYMSSDGSLQSAYHHYQIFYFTITNKAPSVTVYAANENSTGGYEDPDTVYSRSFTNKNVFILNNAQNNDFDAEVDIRISAKDYSKDTDTYFFKDRSITNLSGIDSELEYQTFTGINSTINGKNGILIKNTKDYANATYTIEIKAANMEIPSIQIQTFTIDTQGISGIKAYNTTKTDSSFYKLEELIGQTGVTNRPIALSWEAKDSGAATYGYLKHIPFTEIQNPYPTDDPDTLSNFLYNLLETDINMLPVSSQIDFSKASNWSAYKNSVDYSSIVPATHVRTENGIYILQVYDEAGNCSFAIFMIDKTSPIFVQVTDGNQLTYEIMGNGSSISVPGDNTDVYVKWAENKGILMKDYKAFTDDTDKDNFKGYGFSGIDNVDEEDFKAEWDKFIEGRFNNVTGISSNSGYYYYSKINDKFYIKERSPSYSILTNEEHAYQITFLDNKGTSTKDDDVALQGTYKILIRDESNAYNYQDESINYINYPSAFLSFNVTSDSSKLDIIAKSKDGKENSLEDTTGVSQVAPLYEHTSTDAETKYQMKPESSSDNPSSYTVLNSFRNPIKVSDNIQELILTFIPNPTTGPKLEFVKVRYYPYITDKQEDKTTGNIYFYKTIQNAPSTVLDAYTYDSTFAAGEEKIVSLAFGQDNKPVAGKYEVVRQYQDEAKIDPYDFFKRTITFYVDNNGIISSLESVSNGDKTALESIIGGDIVINMHSENHQSDISVSFPTYKDGLNYGSLFSKTSFDMNDVDETVATSLTTNKLPLKLNIPKYKYTISSTHNTDDNSFNLDINEALSYYGNVEVKKEKDSTIHNLYVNDILYMAGFTSEEDAWEYAYNNLSITEYELSALIRFSSTDGKSIKYYRTKPFTAKNGSPNSYLEFYKVSSATSNDYASDITSDFHEAGKYTVILYQGDAQSPSYSIYKFAFEITKSSPDFEIKNSLGYNLEPVAIDSRLGEIFYTNSDSLTISWEDPTDPYLAKIDREQIKFGSKKITVEENKTSFTVNNCVNDYLLNGQGYVTITLQYEGHSAYYNQAIKTVYFDIEAPKTNIENLMAATESSTNGTLSVDYQKQNMHRYFDYNDIQVDPIKAKPGNSQPDKASYIFNTDSGTFRNFAFSVNDDFFKNIKDTIDKKEISEIYYNAIPSIAAYTQSNKNSPIDQYSPISEITESDIKSMYGYYEIVETDYAGNMTVYVVFVAADKDDVGEDEFQSLNTAISYTNKTATEAVTISNDEVVDGLNIYSNTGFTLKSLNYNQDEWLYFETLSYGSTSKYIKSPWLKEGQVYKLNINSNKQISYQIYDLSNVISSTIQSSKVKRQLVLADRMTGETKTVYLAIMDQILTIQKVVDNVAENQAIISMNVPTKTQHASTETAYIYPTNVLIEVFEDKEWVEVCSAKQTDAEYGTWTKSGSSSNAVSFSDIANGKLKVAVEIGAKIKVKFSVTDNFGNPSTIIILTGTTEDESITAEDLLYVVDEFDGKVYISQGAITYSYNTNHYEITVEPEEVHNIVRKDDKGKIQFIPNSTYYDGYFKITVNDVTTEDYIKTFYIRLYKQLPEVITNSTDASNGGIIFLDKKYENIGEDNISQNPSIDAVSLIKDGQTFTARPTTVTTFSRNVTLRYKNGMLLANNNISAYNKSITYSVFLSRDNGSTWENIDTADEIDVNSYTISGVGKYYILVHYNDSELLTEKFKIFELNILDSAAAYYYITVDGEHVEKSTGIKYSLNNQEYEVTYIVGIDYNDKYNRLSIHDNKELYVTHHKTETYWSDSTEEGVVYDPEVPRGTIVTEIYSYECEEAKGEFVIIYIPHSSNIVGSFSYETATGATESLKDGITRLVAANKETESSFNKLKLSYSSYYGVAQNEIKLRIYKFFNGGYSEIICPSYKADENSAYCYIEMSGSYRIEVIDSCTPANIQDFGGKTYVDIIFLSSVPFEVITIDTDGNDVVTAPIQRAIYNSEVKLKLTNLATYYLPTGYPVISATRNGKEIKVSPINNTYTFSEPGFYTVKFSATSTPGVELREEEYSFTIINKNESRYAFEYSQYKEYYIQEVWKNGVDVTKEILKISGFKTISVKGADGKYKEYLSALTLNHLDEKTGSGRYSITININNEGYSNVLGGNKFTFDLWINMAKPPINVSIAEGESTTSPITITFNVQNLYNAVGDCYIQVGSMRKDITEENATAGNDIITISAKGTHFIQVYTQSGRLLYSYKVTKTDPLNTFAILAIVLGVIAAVAIIIITVKLRKRQKVK